MTCFTKRSKHFWLFGGDDDDDDEEEEEIDHISETSTVGLQMTIS